jgi:cytochrome P450
VTTETVHERLAKDLWGTVSWLLAQDGPVLDPQAGTWFVARYTQVRAMLTDRRVAGRSSEHGTSDLSTRERANVAPIEDHFRRWLVFSDAPAREPLRVLFRRAVAAFADTTSLRPLVPTRLAEIDLVAQFAKPFTLNAVSTLLGLDDTGRIGAHGTDLLAYLGLDRYDETVVSKAKQAVAALRDHFEGDYLAHAKGVLPDAFRQALTDGADPDDVLAVFTQVLTGGLDPTQAVLVEGMDRCSDPLQLKAFEVDPESFADELCRLASPFHYAPRAAAADIDIAGRTIPAGARVALVLAAANRDPAQFPVPHEVHLARARRRHLAFGWGRHVCLGARLAELVVIAGLRALTRHPEWPVNCTPHRLDIRTGGMTRAGEFTFLHDQQETHK